MYRLGIDIGGTHVDFAVVDLLGNLLYGHKVMTQDETHHCIALGIEHLIQHYHFDPKKTDAIHFGSTLALNSLLELKSLYKVGLIRIAGHTPDYPPAYQWPAPMRNAILAGYRTINGGKEYDNKPISTLDTTELIHAARHLLTSGAESLAIISVFSPLYAEDEMIAETIIHQTIHPLLPVSLSHTLGNLGFIERENTTIINAALKKVIHKGFSALSKTLNQLGFLCECYITQNNGTLLTLEDAFHFPIRTIASGPTNSLTGACKLAHCHNAVVVDIGGTSTDIGLVENGFPVYSLKSNIISGVHCHLLAPDILSLAMGGGSLLYPKGKKYRIGPDSVGGELFNRCRTHGGPDLTVYDAGQILKKKTKIHIGLSDEDAQEIIQQYLDQINQTIHHIIPNSDSRPILLVGGGSENFPDILLPKRFIRPPHYAIANAYGASQSEIAGEIDCIIQLNHDRESQLQALEEEAEMIAIKKGAAKGTIRIIDKRILPLHYLQESYYRVKIIASGHHD